MKKPAFPGMISFLIMLTHLICCSIAGLNKAPPILWRQTKRPVISGITELYLEILYEYPCYLLSPDKLPPGSYDMIQNWCRDITISDFLDPLTEFCPLLSPHAKLTASRKKRVLPAFVMAAAAAVTIISVFTTIGVSSAALYKSGKADSSAQLLQEELDEMTGKLAALVKNEDHIKGALKKLTLAVENTMKTVNEHTRLLNNLTQTFPSSLILFSHLTGKLSITKTELHYIGRMWRQWKVHEALFRLFNITSPCVGECPLELMTPIHCIQDRGARTLHMKIRAPTVNGRMHIVDAEPFTFFKRIGNRSLCSYKYTGPNTILFSEETGCATPMEGIAEASPNNVFLHGIQGECSNFNGSAFHYWRPEPCTPKGVLKELDIVQVKQDGARNLIYCNLFNITVHNFTQPCPDYVFTLPATVSFKIGSLQYRASANHLAKEYNMRPEWSHRINFQLMPRLHDLNPDRDLRDVHEEVEKINIELPEIHFLKHPTTYTSCLIILILLIALGALFYNLKYKRTNVIPPVRYLKAPDESDADETETKQQVADQPQGASVSVKGKAKRIPALLTILMLLSIAVETECFCAGRLMLKIQYSAPCKSLNGSEMERCKSLNSQFINPLKHLCDVKYYSADLILNAHGNFHTRITRGALNNTRKMYSPPNPDVTKTIATLKKAWIRGYFISSEISMVPLTKVVGSNKYICCTVMLTLTESNC